MLAAGLMGASPADRPMDGLPESSALGAASTRMTVEGVEIEFSAEFARVSTPGIPGHWSSVSVTLRRLPPSPHNPTPQPLPAGIAIEQVYVVRGDRVWITAVQEPARQPVGWLRASARGGPLWEPEQTVDIFALVRSPDGAHVYLSARGRRIREER